MQSTTDPLTSRSATDRQAVPGRARGRLTGLAGITLVVGILAVPGDATDLASLAGLELLLLSGTLLPFLAGLAARLRRAAPAGTPWPSAALAAGAVAVAVKIATAGPGWAARDASLDADIAAALQRVNEIGFITFLGPLGVAMGAIAVGVLRHGGLPRWLAWAAAPVAVALAANSLALDAQFGPALLLFLLWVLCCSATLLIRPEAGEPKGARPLPSSMNGPHT